MSTVMRFDEEDRIRILCQCGAIEGKVESTEWGVRIFFKCRDCDTSVAMEVTQ